MNEAHEAVDIILRENPYLSYGAQNMLRELRGDIYHGLDGERSARITIYVLGENSGAPFKFKIGGGSQHLIANISDNKISFSYSTGRYWTRFHRGVLGFFKALAVKAVGALPFSRLALQW